MKKPTTSKTTAKATKSAKPATKPAKPAKSSKKLPPLFTIGYEHATSKAVLDALTEAGVELLVDTRAVAASRRPGFSKRQLAASLDERGIDYLHLRGLGTPTEGRNAAHSGHLDEMFRIYEKHVRTPEAREQLDELVSLVSAGRRVCLLCYERDVNHCHRRRIAELVCERIETKTDNLVPSPV
jgi:uncharacterized protein (DUF488 family)